MPVVTPVQREEPQDGGESSRRNARRGLVLFGAYCVIYGGFVLLCAFSPGAMEWAPVAGLSLAVVYGMGLIGGAMALAVLYTWLCRGSAN
jgi:uncharacterized membrane protein (DUF485 family)